MKPIFICKEVEILLDSEKCVIVPKMLNFIYTLKVRGIRIMMIEFRMLIRYQMLQQLISLRWLIFNHILREKNQEECMQEEEKQNTQIQMTIPFQNGIKRNTSLRRSIDLNSWLLRKNDFRRLNN